MFTERQKRIIHHAYETVPFYADLCREKGLEYRNFVKWEDIPTVSKNDVVLHNNAFISSKYLLEESQGRLLCTHTSGSTGKCTNVYWNLEECRYSLTPLWLRRRRYYKISTNARYCYFFTSRHGNSMNIEKEESEFALGFSKQNLDEEKLVYIWGEMRKFRPEWLNLQPSMALLLCQVIRKYQLKLISSLKYVELTGEMLFPAVKNLLEVTLKVKVVNQYGSIEMNSIAFECPMGHLHCLKENVNVEIVDKNGTEVPLGKEGEICVTTLTNYAMPLIRYKLGDYGRLSTVKCSCGEKGLVLELTKGRCNDYIIDSEGVLLNPYIFVHCVENVNKKYEMAILQFQIIQRTTSNFTVNFVLDTEYMIEQICDCFIRGLEHTSLSSAVFDFYIHQEIFPEQSTGKLRWFINEIGGDLENMIL